jgi:adenosylcobinamide-GDP ribazoletransferase
LIEQDGPDSSPETRPSLAFFQTVLRLLRFFSRLPVPVLGFEREPHGLPDPAWAAVSMTAAAVLIALPGALVLLLAMVIGLPVLVGAGLGLLVLAITTGGLHEDGLADTVDAFSGGWTAERALDIMRDSRIGAHGTLAIVLAVLLQTSALAAVLDRHGLWAAVLAFISAAVTSRVLALAPLSLLDPARSDGRGASFGQPTMMSLIAGMAIATLLALAVALATQLSVMGALVGLVGAIASVALILRLAQRKIGGQTGDICGACQQIAVSALLIGFCLR